MVVLKIWINWLLVNLIVCLLYDWKFDLFCEGNFLYKDLEIMLILLLVFNNVVIFVFLIMIFMYIKFLMVLFIELYIFILLRLLIYLLVFLVFML